jgi:hypothetical protein
MAGSCNTDATTFQSNASSQSTFIDEDKIKSFVQYGQHRTGVGVGEHTIIHHIKHHTQLMPLV